MSDLDNPRVAALHKSVYGEVVHSVLSDNLGRGLVRLERVQQNQWDICGDACSRCSEG